MGSFNLPFNPVTPFAQGGANPFLQLIGGILGQQLGQSGQIPVQSQPQPVLNQPGRQPIQLGGRPIANYPAQFQPAQTPGQSNQFGQFNPLKNIFGGKFK